jgi:hypothetical protein
MGHLKDQGDRRITLRSVFRKLVVKDERWIELPQDSVQWQDLVLKAMNIGFCYSTRYLL